jgi:hypothetical protein
VVARGELQLFERDLWLHGSQAYGGALDTREGDGRRAGAVLR